MYLVAGLSAVAAVLRFSTLGRQSFWYDEVPSRPHSPLFPSTSSCGPCPTARRAPPLYYVLVWIWAHVFGSSDLALRSLSALVGTLVVPAAYLAARALVSRWAGILVATFAAVSPLLVWYSQEARPTACSCCSAPSRCTGSRASGGAVTEAGLLLGSRVLPGDDYLLLCDLPRCRGGGCAASSATASCGPSSTASGAIVALVVVMAAACVCAGTHRETRVDRRNTDSDPRRRSNSSARNSGAGAGLGRSRRGRVENSRPLDPCGRRCDPRGSGRPALRPRERTRTGHCSPLVSAPR